MSRRTARQHETIRTHHNPRSHHARVNRKSGISTVRLLVEQQQLVMAMVWRGGFINIGKQLRQRCFFKKADAQNLKDGEHARVDF